MISVHQLTPIRLKLLFLQNACFNLNVRHCIGMDNIVEGNYVAHKDALISRVHVQV